MGSPHASFSVERILSSVCNLSFVLWYSIVQASMGKNMFSSRSLRSRGASRRLLSTLSLLGLARAEINNDASAFEIKFNESSVGPDGPWNYIVLADPDNSQYIAVLPSVAKTSLLVNASAGCSMLGSTCPQPDDLTWKSYDAWVNADGKDSESYLMPPSDWDEEYTALLNLTGAGNFFTDQVVLQSNGNFDHPATLEHQGLAISKDWTVNLAAKQYTKSFGLFSLDGSSNNLTYGTSQDQTIVANTSLQTAYDAGYIPSMSYGMHIGSAEPFVAGSLVLGGYDKSRILSDAIVAGNDNVFRLTDIALNVSRGDSAWTSKSSSSYESGLLKTSEDFGEYVQISPRPGLPYLYLPKESCDAIAEHLPVTYSADYNLYLWDTKDSAYEDIVTSPHYLSFLFTDDTKTTAHINVPFALLNLTLDLPLASKPTQYFPCSPWDDVRTASYTLGNAFLQAAFLSQHWQMNTTVLAQAPGPDYQEANVQAIPHDSDTTVGAAGTAATWDSTWEKTLKSLDSSSSSSSSGGSSSSDSATNANDSNNTQANTDSDSSPPSGGAIAGIVIGVIAGLSLIGALTWFFLRRRRNSSSTTKTAPKHDRLPSNIDADDQDYHDSPRSQELEAGIGGGGGFGSSYNKPVHEIESTALMELPVERQKAELPAHDWQTQQQRLHQRSYELAGDGPVIAEKSAEDRRS